MKNKFTRLYRKLYALLLFGFVLFLPSQILAQAEINPSSFVYNDFDDVDIMVTTITWNGATEVTRVYFDIMGDEIDFMYDVEDDNGTTASLLMYPPAKNINAAKSNEIEFNGFVVFDFGDPAEITITILNPTLYTEINVRDQEDNSPISNASVYIQELDEYFYTDGDGFIELILDEGEYTIDIEANGYFPVYDYTITVEFNANLTSEFFIYLDKDINYLVVISTDPHEGQTGVDVNKIISVKFDRNIQQGIINFGYWDIRLFDQMSNPWSINDIYEMGNVLYIEPNHPLNQNETYSLYVPYYSVVDIDNVNNVMEQDINVSFTTYDGMYYFPDISPYENYFSLMEPDDVSFNIFWGSETEISDVYYVFWDDLLNDYGYTLLQIGTDYSIDENNLIFHQTYLEDQELQTGDHIYFEIRFSEEVKLYASIKVFYTFNPTLSPDLVLYDLSNPNEVFTNIIYASANNIVEITDDGLGLIEGQDYYITGSWLFFNESYLSSNLVNVDDEIALIVSFDTEHEISLILKAVETGLLNATINPNSATINESELPEYIDLLVTWNDASFVQEIWASYVEDGELFSFEWTNYDVLPVDEETSILRVFFDENKSLKAVEYFYVNFDVFFDAGASTTFFLTILYEYYTVYADSNPYNGGWVQGAFDYEVGEEVTLEAMPNVNFDFVKWELEGGLEVFDNPYIFDMPSEDVYITAHFLANYLDVLYTNPENNAYDVSVNANIYITFNRSIQEGTLNNGFDDIIFQELFGGAWGISDIYIEDGNVLVIVPESPLNYYTVYELQLVENCVADADDISNALSWTYILHFTTEGSDYFSPYIFPNEQIFSLLEPEDIEFFINWGSENTINSIVFYYWDDEDEYQEMLLNNGSDYIVNENSFTITQDFISSLNPQSGWYLGFYAEFGTGWQEFFYIEIVYTMLPYLSPATVYYDLDNPNQVLSNIIYASANAIVSITNDGVLLTEGSDYNISGTLLFITNDYLSVQLIDADDFILLEISFDSGHDAELNIIAIESGVVGATITPESAQYYEWEEPEYQDIVITWNDATELNNVYVYLNEGGEIEIIDYPYYDIFDIDEETSLLRIYFMAKSSDGIFSNQKALEYFYVPIELVFDIGPSAFFYLSFVYEYYMVNVEILPEFSGNVDGYGAYSPEDEVYLEAYPNWGYEFLNWRVNGVVVSSDNPFIFEMPYEDINLTAHFISETQPTYTLTLIANPEVGGVVLGSGDFGEGDNVTITAVPASGFTFVEWLDDNEDLFSDQMAYTFQMPAENIVLTAFFTDDTKSNVNSADSRNIFPNPFSDYLNISSFDDVNKLIFTNAAGQTIDIIQTISEGQINTSSLPAGFYILIIETNSGERIAKKLIKQ